MSAGLAIPIGASLLWVAIYAAAALRSPGWPRRRIAYAAVGLGAVTAGSLIADEPLALDMGGHAAVVAVGVPLVVLSRPLALLHRALGHPARTRLVAGERRVLGALEPWTWWAAFVGAQWLFHLGPIAGDARGDGPLHGLEHAVFFATALMFWSAALAPAPGMRRMSAAERCGYLLAAVPALDLIGAIWIGQGLTAAGAAMIGGMLPIGIAFLIVAWRALDSEERVARRLDLDSGRRRGTAEAWRG